MSMPDVNCRRVFFRSGWEKLSVTALTRELGAEEMLCLLMTIVILQDLTDAMFRGSLSAPPAKLDRGRC